MVEIFGKLGIDGTIFFQFGIFLILAILLKKLLFNPLQQVIQERSNQTTGLQGKAEQIMEEGLKIKESNDLKLTEARQNLYFDLKKHKDILNLKLEEKFKQSEIDSENTYNQNLKELNSELSLLNDQLAKNTDELSVLLTSKLTK
jgi:F0F1-type ATP synthase membrane subunit b/b'